MSNQPELNKYKQEIADLYTRRSQTYDNSDWHLQTARRLVEYGRVGFGQQILDMATGTGHVAIAAAEIVGSQGRVIGVDIATGMLDIARSKAQALSLKNTEFILADAETLDFPVNTCDRIFCASAFIWMSDLHATLTHWHKFLKPGGILGIHAFADTAFVGGVVTQKVAKKYGISFNMSKPTGTVEKCHSLLEQAGFKDIEIKIQQDGSYISLEKAKAMWAGSSHPAPGQYPPPLSTLSTEQLAQAKAEFENELESLQTERGIWNDITTIYVFGRK
ncbi:methyltransferase domain-containing protein [Microcoleus sp. bin38.metabat.b11b12b14.051]|uniref:class I SAM-dependent methyltransferase n=1 Tax=Microcoleus sp. bin38.metabat.b11b12b14.051 TaxID=2742709 RepID=UPI0025DA3FAD|nr:methyltransferase domain-containing protein [Microcoleus sp. bin38.metabat.b11b12b14.051]